MKNEKQIDRFLQAFFIGSGKKKIGANNFQPTMDNNEINFIRVVERYTRKRENPWGYVFTNVSMKGGNGNSRLPGFVYVNHMETSWGGDNDKYSRPVVIVYDFNDHTARVRKEQAKKAAEKLDAEIIYVTVGYFERNGKVKYVMTYEPIKIRESFGNWSARFTLLKNGPSNLHPNYYGINKAVVFYVDKNGYTVICPLSGYLR